jgi:ribosomal protein L3 glutamine methyltransferase
MAHDELPEELITVRDFLRWAVSRFNEAGLHFGHGTQDAYDEAAYLILHALHLPHDRLEPFLDASLVAYEREALFALLGCRVRERLPAPYLTHEAWLGDFSFYVDERVIVPRSHIAELLLDDPLMPWLADPDAVETALDLCTGSGCLAILLAHAFPRAHVDAADISRDALDVAAKNVADYGLGERIELVRSDLFAGLAGRRYDVIISNPPYVTGEAMRALPAEYRHEPVLALASGEDGLDAVRGILGGARNHLKPGGILAVEVGGNRAIVENAFPQLPFIWLESANGEGMVFLLQREQLPE